MSQQTMITVSLFLIASLAINVKVDAVSFNNQGINPSHFSLSRVRESQHNGLGRVISSAALNISGGSVGGCGGGSGTVTFATVDHTDNDDDLNESTLDSTHTTLPQEEHQQESTNDSSVLVPNEIIRGGDTTGVAVMKYPHSKVKPSFTGTASVVQKNKLGRIKAKNNNKSHLKIAKKLKVRF